VFTELSLAVAEAFCAGDCGGPDLLRTEAAAAASELKEDPHWAVAVTLNPTASIVRAQILTAAKR